MATLKPNEKTLDYHRAELKKLSSGQSGAGADGVTTSSWPLFPCLNYLKNSMQTRPRTTNLTQNANNSVENASENTSVDFSHFIVDENSEKEICNDNEIIRSTENNVKEKNVFNTISYNNTNYFYMKNIIFSSYDIQPRSKFLLDFPFTFHFFPVE